MHYGKDFDGTSQSSPPSVTTSETMFDNLTDNLETSLMQNDVLNRQRNPPISYLQNRVNSTTGDLPRKVVNNPNSDNESNVTPKHNQLSKSKKAKEMGFLGHLAILGKLAFGSKFSDDKYKHEENQAPIRRKENGLVYESIGQNNPLFEPSQGVETEVQITNTGPVVRPTSLAQSKDNTQRQCEVAVNNEVKVNKGDSHKERPTFSRLRGAPYSKSTSDLSPQKSNDSDKLERDARLNRPSTLSLKGHNYTQRQPSNSLSSLPFFKNSVLRGSGSQRTLPNGYKLIKPPYPEPDPQEKIKARIKTPLINKKGRLSLYDDRLMSNMKEKECSDGDKVAKTNMTMQQFKEAETAPNLLVSADCTC